MKKIFHFLKQRPGFFALILILVFITLVNLKPDFYLLGWDNYSSYFNQPFNFIRTLFSSWRGYRGLGVPSDSEVVDIFRQFFFVLIVPIFGEKLADQIYLISVLWAGTIGMYVLAKYLILKLTRQVRSDHLADLFSFVASFFYLFNLNTLAVFYFPMIMFVNRYFSLPLVFWVFLRLINENKFQKREIFLFILILLFSMGSFVEASVFITFTISLFLLIIFQKNKKRGILVFVIYIGLNFFWLLPFANYTMQKAKYMPLVPTFKEANEANLNKASEFFSVKKQAVFFPSFFETNTTSAKTKETIPLHPLAKNLNSEGNLFLLLIFPVLYLLGSLLIFNKYKKNRELLWIPLSVGLFLFLSMKEYSILGFLYDFLNKNIPFFGIVFRFGDTKFHSHLAFVGSLAAAYFVLKIIELTFKFKKAIIKPVIILGLIFVVLNLNLFKSYFNGNLIGFFMYNKLPESYREVAKIINVDPEMSRVIHLPYNATSYWKAYSWGSFGSAFFQFLINKPLLDRTFEPPSMENVYADNRLQIELAHFQEFKASEQKTKAQEIYKLLQTLGVKYILLDESVTAEIQSRGLIHWENYSVINEKLVCQSLAKLGLTKLVYKKTSSLKEFMTSYRKLYPYELSANQDSNAGLTLSLYELSRPVERIQFLKKIDKVDPSFNNILETSGIIDNGNYLQKENENSILTPLSRTNIQSVLSPESEFIISPDNTTLVPQKYELQLKLNQDSRVVDVYVSKEKETLTFEIEERLFANINNLIFVRPLASVAQDLKEIDKYSALRLKVNKSVLTMPPFLAEERKYLGSVLINDRNIILSVLGAEKDEVLASNFWQNAKEKNCFGDKSEGYSGRTYIDSNKIRIHSQNGSYCLTSRKIKPIKGAVYMELELRSTGNQKDLDERYAKVNLKKTAIQQFVSVLPKPNLFLICAQETGLTSCLNDPNTIFEATGQKISTVTLDKEFKDESELGVLLALKNLGFQEQKLTIENTKLKQFVVLGKSTVELDKLNGIQIPFEISESEPLELTIPKINSDKAYYQSSNQAYFNNGDFGFFGNSTLCDDKTGYRTIRLYKNKYLNYVDKCQSTLFQSIPFAKANNAYIFSVNYSLLSGQFPSLIVRDKSGTYVEKRLSENQGYPSITGFKKLQPNFITEQTELSKIISSSRFINYALPVFDHALNNGKNKDLVLDRFSENEGLYLLNSYSAVPIPSSWYFAKIVPNDYKADLYSVPDSYSYQEILPSFWKIDLGVVSSGKKQLLKFNEAYDKQWIMLGASSKNYRCDGYANCFEIDNYSGNTIYLLYWPELLFWIGGIISLGLLSRLSRLIHTKI